MKKILETKRMYLREMTENDYDDLCDILQDEEVMYAYEHAFSDEEVTQWLHNQLTRYERDGFGLWAMIDSSSGAFIGQAGLTMQKIGDDEVMEIGYLVKKKYWHQGYATEAAMACKEYAFHSLNAPYVTSIIRDTNVSSQAVAERVGMTKIDEFIKHYYHIDMLHYVYKIMKED